MIVLGAAAAQAHTFEPAMLDLREHDEGVFDLMWTLPLASLAALTPGGQLVPDFPEHCRRTVLSEPSRSSTEERELWRLDCGPAGLHGGAIRVAGLDGARIDVVLRINWRNGDVSSGVLYSGANIYAVPGAGAGLATTLQTAGRYLRLGGEHILLGTDHLLFVLSLLLLVDSWRMLVRTVTAFTVAHSATLALAAIGAVTLPQPPVEALIALSIVFVALELTRPSDTPPTLTRSRPWLVALAFGLLHGLGFAGALRDVGVPQTHLPVALLSFNAGVEVGQLLFIIVVGGPIRALLRRLASWPLTQIVPAYAIGALAFAWTLERIAQF